MDKIQKIFASCAGADRAALVIFCSCGYPDMASSEQIIDDAIAAGADIIELGVPFSDPMADGAAIRQASEVALHNGATLKRILAMAERLCKKHPDTGFILFSYMNVMLNYGLEALCGELRRIGVDGILAVDLPYEEKAELAGPCRAGGLHLIPLVSPATSLERAAMIMGEATGFVYSVNVCGITGIREQLPPEVAGRLAALKERSPVPVAAGFGIADSASAKVIARVADGVVVGSAVISKLLAPGELSARRRAAAALVGSLAGSLSRHA